MSEVRITLGNNVDAIIINGRLMIRANGWSIDLGPATKKRIDNIIEYIQRLKIHAMDI